MPLLAPRDPPTLDGPDHFTLTGVRTWSAGEKRRETTDIAVSGGRITGVSGGPVHAGNEAETTVVGDLRGCTVTPGLIDLHQHLPAANALGLTRVFAVLHLLHGVTTVRDAGDGDGDGSAVPALRAALATDEVPGPRVWACGPYVGRTPASWTNTVIVDDATSPAEIVAEAVRRGAQTIKLYDHLTRADIYGLTAAAAEAGLDTIGHVPSGLAYEDAGIRHVQHFHGVPVASAIGAGIVDRVGDWRSVDPGRLDRIVSVTLEQGLRNTPTLVVTEGVLRAQRPGPAEAVEAAPLPALYPKVVWDRECGLPAYRHLRPEHVERLRTSLELKLELIARLHTAGAPLFIGTDVQQPYVVPGAALHREMRLFARAGLSPEAVLTLATREAGAELGIEGLGTLTLGAPADLLVFAEDPTQSLDALRTLRAVVTGGRLIRVEALQAAAEHARRHYANAVVDRISRIAARSAMRRLTAANAAGDGATA